MAKFNKDGYGKVATENLEGAPVPRDARLRDQTQGKRLGTKDIRTLSGDKFNYTKKNK